MNRSYVLKKLSILVYAAILLAAALLIANYVSAAAEDEPINIVATTTMLADLIDQIGGDHVSVSALMGPGVDPHLYQAGAGRAGGGSGGQQSRVARAQTWVSTISSSRQPFDCSVYSHASRPLRAV